MRERGPHAHDDDRRDKDERHRRRQRFESVLQFAFGFHDEPGAAKQGIGHDEAEACEETEWTEPVKTAAVVGSPRHLEGVDEGAQRDALREGRDVGAPGEGLVPERPVRLVRLEAEFESDAAPDQSCQHKEDRDVERAQQDGISEREDSHQRGSSQHQPGLVAIPDRRNRVHHGIAIAPAADEREQDADSEVETVHHHIHHQSKADDHGPDDRKIDAHRYLLLPPGKSIAGSMRSGTADKGRAGRPLGPSGSGGCSPCGWRPFATSITMYLMPVPNTARYMTMNTISVIERVSAEWFDTASFVRITPYTTQGWRPISVVNHPARSATRPAGPISTAKRRKTFDR